MLISRVWKEYSLYLLTFLWLLRACAILFLEPDTPTIDGDFYYLPLAENLLRFGRYTLSTAQPFLPDVLKMPGYPLFVAGVYALFGQSLTALQLVQVLLDGLTLVFVYRLAFRLGNKNTAKSASLVYIILPYLAFYTATPTRAVPFTLLITMAIYFWVLALQTKILRYFLLSLLVVSVSTYFREDGFYLFLIIWVGTIWSWIVQKIPPKRVLAIAPLLFALVLAPWVIRNYKHFNKFIPFSCMRFSKTIVNANVYFPILWGQERKPWPLLSQTDMDWMDEMTAVYATPKVFADVPYAKHAEVYGNYDILMKKYLKVYWQRYVFIDIPYSFIKYLTSPRLDRLKDVPSIFAIKSGLPSAPFLYLLNVSSRVVHTLLYVLGLSGLVLLFFRNKGYAFLPLVAFFPILGASIICLPIPRYELPAIPLLIVGAIVFLQDKIVWKRLRKCFR